MTSLLTLPVAETRPCIPPCRMGFPVTHAGAFISPWPTCKTNVKQTISFSITQTMGLVMTTAGTVTICQLSTLAKFFIRQSGEEVFTPTRPTQHLLAIHGETVFPCFEMISVDRNVCLLVGAAAKSVIVWLEIWCDGRAGEC